MRCHNCEVALDWDGFQEIVLCDVCHTYRSVDVPDSRGGRILALDRPGAFHCPRCRRHLAMAGLEGLSVEHCANCEGVLLTDETLPLFVRNRRADFRHAALQPAPLVSEHPAGLHCPHCRRAMNIHPCYGPDSIVVHSCIGCGLVWLDCRKAPRIVAAPLVADFPPSSLTRAHLQQKAANL